MIDGLCTTTIKRHRIPPAPQTLSFFFDNIRVEVIAAIRCSAGGAGWVVETVHTWVFCGYVIFLNLSWTEVTSKTSAPSFSLILFTHFFYISAPLPSCLPKQPDSVTNFIQYFCQSLYFAFTSTHSLANPSLFHAVCLLIWTSCFQCSWISPSDALLLTFDWPFPWSFPRFLSSPPGEMPPVLNMKLRLCFPGQLMGVWVLLASRKQSSGFVTISEMINEFLSLCMLVWIGQWTVSLIFFRLMHILIGNWDTVAASLSVGGKKEKLSRGFINFRAHKSCLDLRFIQPFPAISFHFMFIRCKQAWATWAWVYIQYFSVFLGENRQARNAVKSFC